MGPILSQLENEGAGMEAETTLITGTPAEILLEQIKCREGKQAK